MYNVDKFRDFLKIYKKNSMLKPVLKIPNEVKVVFLRCHLTPQGYLFSDGIELGNVKEKSFEIYQIIYENYGSF